MRMLGHMQPKTMPPNDIQLGYHDMQFGVYRWDPGCG